VCGFFFLRETSYVQRTETWRPCEALFVRCNAVGIVSRSGVRCSVGLTVVSFRWLKSCVCLVNAVYDFRYCVYLTVGTVPEIVRCTRPLRRRLLGANKLLLPSSLLNPVEVWDPHAGIFLGDVIPFIPTDTYGRFGGTWSFCEQAFIFPDDRCSRFLWNVCTYLPKYGVTSDK